MDNYDPRDELGAMIHVNLRLPKDVVEYFKQYPKYTKQMRTVLTDYVDKMKYAQDDNA